ncbi:hypothetical protein [Acaryochloris sp. IP29b_bin.137]|uniref:hypothetical protein n=1 Tax=Acaryochloris sp. IP29b_bin.137 TaxID=2969217 RepID=UPI002625EC70|nr:hypothetical protein [Acaryochloris sp. IP29b_bin.137]
MKKTTLCIYAVWAWALLLSPSQARPASIQSITLRPRPLQSTVGYSSGSPSRAGCDAEQLPIPGSGQSADSISSPTERRKRLTRTAVWQDLRSHPIRNTNSSSLTLHESDPDDGDRRLYRPVPSRRLAIVEAQGWTRDQNGRIHLTSKPSAFRSNRTDC